MKKILFRTLVGIIAVAFILETPSAFAIFGIRAARTVMAARKAKQVTDSSSSDSDDAYAQEKARFERPARQRVKTGLPAEGSTSNTLKNQERP